MKATELFDLSKRALAHAVGVSEINPTEYKGALRKTQKVVEYVLNEDHKDGAITLDRGDLRDALRAFNLPLSVRENIEYELFGSGDE